MKLSAFCVRGNHDDASLQAWHAWRVGEALRHKLAWVQGLQPQHVELLEGLPFSISIPSYGIGIVRPALPCRIPSTTASAPCMIHRQSFVGACCRILSQAFLNNNNNN